MNVIKMLHILVLVVSAFGSGGRLGGGGGGGEVVHYLHV